MRIVRMASVLAGGEALAAVAAIAALVGAAGVAWGQPAHYPGTLCYTPQFWCYAQPPGPPGTPCVCPTPMGFVPGTRG